MTKPMLLGVADALIISQSGLQMYSATLSSHTIEQTVDSTDLRGGRANKLIGRLKTSKNLSVTLEDLQQTKEMQALLSGSKIANGAMNAYVMPQEVLYVTDGLTLKTGAIDPEKIPCSDVETPTNTLVTQFDGGKLKIGVSGTGGNTQGNVVQEIGQGTKILLGAYEYPANNVDYFKVSGTKFAENVSVVLEEDIYDGETMQIIGVKQTIIPVASPDENFSLSGSREISETTASYTFTALASGECSDLGYVVYLDAPVNIC